MEEERAIDKLRKGEKVICDICKKDFYDVGIAEQHALTFAAGLSKAGMKPFISLYSILYFSK